MSDSTIPGSQNRDSTDQVFGSFTDCGPWSVQPDEMRWRDGVDPLRAAAAARVPDLLSVSLIPPLRVVEVGFRMAGAIVPWLVTHWQHPSEPRALTALGKRLRPTFESLGPTYLKLGQMIASAEGMLPTELVEEFKQCRDRVTPESLSTVRKVVEEDLGRPLEDVFAHFSEEPIASASIAQVHAAQLQSGEEVVVKVQRPGIAAVVSADLAALAWLAPLFERLHSGVVIANLPAYIELLAETIVEELDFRLEAENMLDIAGVLAATDRRAIVVPRPHPELVTRRVLVMEKIVGFAIDDHEAMADAVVDPTEVFRALMVSFYEGALIHGVFHGDLHGGNMLVCADGRPALLDFGITGRFTPEKRVALLGMVMHFMSQDATGMLKCFRDLGGFPPDVDIDAIEREIDLQALLSLDLATMTAETLAEQQRAVIAWLVAHGAKLPKELYLWVKGSVYLNGALEALAVDVDILGEMGHVVEHFAAAHRARVNDEVGLDLASVDSSAMPSVTQRVRPAAMRNSRT